VTGQEVSVLPAPVTVDVDLAADVACVCCTEPATRRISLRPCGHSGVLCPDHAKAAWSLLNSGEAYCTACLADVITAIWSKL
jgi:hypothetical protein